MNDKFYVTDCEGPLSVNDNAYEISDFFIPDGGRFFGILSNYDDILAQQNTGDYLAGSTLKLILPFFKAYGLTERDLAEFSEDNIFMIDGAYDMIEYVQDIMPCYIVSTSYSQYIKALSDKTGFVYENTYSTNLELDKYSLTPDEQDKLLDIHDNILFDSGFDNLNRIFTEVISKMQINSLVESVKPVGGIGKRNAVLDIIEKNNYKPENLMYSGDSITDKEALEYAKDNGGLGISFNGNIHSINAASVSVTSTNNLVLAVIAEIFNKKGTEGVYDFISDYHNDSLEAILNCSDNAGITRELLVSKPSVDIITDDNKKNLTDMAKTVRNKVRGKNIGNLG